MTTYIKLDEFKKIFPKAHNPDKWVTLMNKMFPLYDIITPNRIASFLAQCGVETAGWTKFEENMNYSAERLVEVWPRIFNESLAKEYQNKPVKIANLVYANRMGNGGPESDDGWMFRGRGPIHLTGRYNYTEFAIEMFDDPGIILVNPSLLALDEQISLQSALWFWHKKNLNTLADNSEFTMLTNKINGGYNGLQERINLYNKVHEIIKL